jgi:hypothetical protein
MPVRLRRDGLTPTQHHKRCASKWIAAGYESSGVCGSSALRSTHQRMPASDDPLSGYSEMALGKYTLISKVHVHLHTTGSADDCPARGVAGTDRAARSRSAKIVLNGKAADDRWLRKAAEAAIGDARASAPYKREQLRGYLRRAVLAAPNRTGPP